MTNHRSLLYVLRYLFCICLTYLMFVWLQGQSFTDIIYIKNMNRVTLIASFLTVSALWYMIFRSKIHGLRLFILIFVLTSLFLPVTEVLLKSAMNNNMNDTIHNYLSRNLLLKLLVYSAYPLLVFIMAAGWKRKKLREHFYYSSHTGFFSYCFRFVISLLIYPLTLGVISLFSPSSIISLDFIIRPGFITAMGLQFFIVLVVYFILLKTGRGLAGERIFIFSIVMSCIMLFHMENGNNWIFVVAAAQFISLLTAGPTLLTNTKKTH